MEVLIKEANESLLALVKNIGETILNLNRDFVKEKLD